MTKPASWDNKITGHAEVDPADLLAHPHNARLHPRHQQDALRGVIADIGFIRSVTVNEVTGHVVDGHLRVTLALRDGIPLIPVEYVRLTEAEEAEALVTLDPIAALAGLDAANLSALLEQVTTADAAVMAMLGDLAASAGIAPRLPEPGAGGDDFDTTPADGPTRTQAGDLWQLGRHRLLVGDCADPANVARLMDGGKIDLCFTSPPYTDQREYKAGPFDWTALMCGAFSAVISNASENGQILINLGMSYKDGRADLYWEQWLAFAVEQGWPLFGWYVWDKGPGMPGDHHGRLARAHEFVFHFNGSVATANKWVATKTHAPKNTSAKRFRERDGSLKRADSPDKIGQPFKVPDSVIRIMCEKRNGIHSDHPAVYPVALPTFGIDTWTRPGDIVYDPFLGSGTTLIAAERTGRTCYGCEIAPVYADVILRRWEAETGQVAQKVDV